MNSLTLAKMIYTQSKIDFLDSEDKEMQPNCARIFIEMVVEENRWVSFMQTYFRPHATLLDFAIKSCWR